MAKAHTLSPGAGIYLDPKFKFLKNKFPVAANQEIISDRELKLFIGRNPFNALFSGCFYTQQVKSC